MILSTRKTNIFLCQTPTDMRLGFNGLSALVRKKFKTNPYGGQYYAFVNRRRNRCKVYTFDGTGEVLLCKRLTQGLFCRPNPRYKKQIKLTANEFGQYFEGLNLSGRLLESRPNDCPKRKNLRFIPAYRSLVAYDGGRTGDFLTNQQGSNSQ